MTGLSGHELFGLLVLIIIAVTYLIAYWIGHR